MEEGVLLAQHRLADTELYTDEALVEIIDSHPPADMSVNTMGVDPNRFDWREGDRNGVSGQVLLDLIRRGQLWINCRNMLDHHPNYARIIHALYYFG